MRPSHRSLTVVALAGLTGCYAGLDTAGGRGSGSAEGGGSAEEGGSEGSGASGGSAGTTASSGGSADEGGGDEGGETTCTTPTAGPSPLRRLTREQYANTVRDLVGVEVDTRERLTSDEKIGAFYSNLVAPVSELAVEQLMDLSEEIATEVATDLPAILPCDPSAGEDACADEFIAGFGLRAYRRPLADADTTRLRGLYDTGKQGGGFENGVRLVIQAMLQSPSFVYHLEPSLPAAGTAIVALDDWELASRLSYFLWSSMPDDELFAAAEAGELTTGTGLLDQATRMLADPRAADAIGSFHVQWLGAADLETVDKDLDLFPAFTPELRAALLEETRAFPDWVIRQGDGKLETLLTADFSLIDGPLFELYGATEPPGHDPSEPVTFPAGQRAGLITLGSFLAAHAHANQGSPVHRGVVVREHFMCQDLPPPPPDVDNAPPDPDPNGTTRERFAEHTANPECASCHRLIDGIGFGFENYDAIGRYRDQEAGMPVDASGEVVGSKDMNGPFVGAVELAGKMAVSDQVRECVTTQWIRFALGRMDQDADECSMQAAQEAFAASGYDLRELLMAIVASDAFRHRGAGA